MTTILVETYLNRIQKANTEKERKHITDDLLLFYYRLDGETQATVSKQMQPTLNELGRKLAQDDQLIRQAHELLKIAI